MIKGLNECNFMKAFERADRDYYSCEGYKALYDYYEELNPDMELDVIAICCEWTEYGERAYLSISDLINDCGYLYPVGKWLEDNEYAENEYNADEDFKNAYIDGLIDVLEKNIHCIRLSHGVLVGEW